MKQRKVKTTPRKKPYRILLAIIVGSVLATIVGSVVLVWKNLVLLYHQSSIKPIVSGGRDAMWNANLETDSSPSKLSSSSSTSSLMVIAIYPRDDLRKAALWSQLECFADRFDRIIISAPLEYAVNVTQILIEVNQKLPDIAAKLEVNYYTNDRYDFGLWCDALTQTNILQPVDNNGTTTYVGGSSSYDQFLLINDSLMAVERTNEFLDALTDRNASLVALNEWTVDDSIYWVESPARAFSREGIQVFADHVCPIKLHDNWRINCPLLNKKHWVKGVLRKIYPNPVAKQKRCIVETTEINVAGLYPRTKVHGLYPGHDEQNKSWSINYEFWSTVLRDKMSFPAVKTSSDFVIGVGWKQPDVVRQCMTKTDKFMDWRGINRNCRQDCTNNKKGNRNIG